MNKYPTAVLLLFFTWLLPCELPAIDLFLRHIDAAEWPALRLHIRALDRTGYPIEDLSREQFLVQSDGHTLPIDELLPMSTTQEGMDLVLVLDTSGTMKGEPLNDAKIAIYSLLDRISDNDRLTVVAFDDEAYLMTELATDKQQLRSMIDQLNVAGSNSVLFKAVVRGIRHLQQAGRVGKGAVIVVSDGYDESSGAYQLDDCIRQSQEADVPIFTLGLTKGDPSHLENLEKMAEQTGGIYSRAFSSSQLTSLYQSIYERLRKQYVLVCRAPPDIQPGGQHVSLQVALSFDNQYEEISSGYIAPNHPVAEIAEEAPQEETFWKKYQVWLACGALLFVGIPAVAWFVQRRKRKTPLVSDPPSTLSEANDEKRTQLSKTIERPLIHRDENEKTTAPMVESALMEPSTQPDKTTEHQDGRRRGQTMVAARRPKIWAELVCISGIHTGEDFAIWNKKTTIGTRPGNDIVFKDDAISGQHMYIERDEDIVRLVDRDSTNGTYLNGLRVGTEIIKSGDTITLGISEFTFRLK
jgi:VWFA-related protein